VGIVVVQADGSQYAVTAIVAIIVAVTAGELGETLGVFDRMLPARTTHVMAAIETALAIVVLVLVARSQREKEEAEARERDTRERFRALVQHASDGIIVIEDGGRVMYASPAAEHILGIEGDALAAFDPTWIDADHVDAVVEIFRMLRECPGAVEAIEVPLARSDGTSRWVEVHITNLIDSPAVGGYVCNLRDIGERHVAQLKLLHDARHDTLTRLPNRRSFMDRLEQAWITARADSALAALFVDVDNFKSINDGCGHDTGDQALVTVADELTRLVRPTDMVARFGGDEFIVLLEDVAPPEMAFEIAERITKALSGPRVINGHEIVLSVSVGVSTAVCRDGDYEDLLREADRAMYLSKQAGRARWTAYEPSAAAS
jgi:diguanylate cyclase (GGDEF)-like protein/PAS domain S-box-containing protein